MPENKLRINDSAEPAREEERISKKKAKELFENNMLGKLEPGKFVSLQRIHKFLFEDIYYFAGEIRDVEIKHVLQNALTDKTDSREIYMKGIDNSYFYEGYKAYKTEEL